MTEHDPRRYPVGPFQPRTGLTSADRDALITELAHFPADLRFLVQTLSDQELGTRYREGGWTVRQVVHHIPDSHLQGYVRFKLAVTEDAPAIKTYDQAPWGELADARNAPVAWSLDLLEALHGRWAFFLRTLTEADFQRTYAHPELGEVTLEKTLQLYVWHGRHHLGHIRLVAEGKSS
jgi:uncharacterized damage-inducible protein DinB